MLWNIHTYIFTYCMFVCRLRTIELINGLGKKTVSGINPFENVFYASQKLCVIFKYLKLTLTYYNYTYGARFAVELGNAVRFPFVAKDDFAIVSGNGSCKF